MSAPSSIAPAGSGMLVVPCLIPASQTTAQFSVDSASQAASSQNYPKSTGRRLQVLGKIQILISLVVLLFGSFVLPHRGSDVGYNGSSMFGDPYSLTSDSRVLVWGSLSFISAGAVTLAAGKLMTNCLVKAALGLALISGLTSVIAAAIFTIDACHQFWNSYGFEFFSHSFLCGLVVLSIVDFFISVLVAVIASKFSCRSTDQPVVVVNPTFKATVETQTAPPTSQAPPIYEPTPTSQTPPSTLTQHTYEPTPISEAPPPPKDLDQTATPGQYDKVIRTADR